jgi:hypothetical protein
MRDKQGGKVIGSGGFGCVFKPALKCKDSNQRTDGISKMLLNKDAKDEWDEITKVKVIISKIPNNDKYFLIDNMNKCKPDKLNNEDKTNLQSCSSLSKSGINSFNINFKLDNVEIINMPDGGVDIRSIFEFTYIKFEIVNASLINLLIHGIIPMNNLGLFHNDLKGENILYKNEQSRIIDWGLASIQKNNEIPSIITDRVIQFNVPFSNILFNSFFYDWYPNELLKNKITEKSPFLIQQLEFIAINWIELWRKTVGGGHIEHIEKHILYPIFLIYNIPLKNTDFLFLLFASKYIAKILYEYTDFTLTIPKFKYQEYYNDVYKYNCDIWGFIISYAPIMKNNYFKNQIKDSSKIDTYKKNISDILLKYCFSNNYAAKKINSESVIKDLENIKNLNYKILNNNDISNILTNETKKQEKMKNVISSSKSYKKSSSKNNSSKKISSKKDSTRKRKRCPNGTRKNSKGECIPKK